MTMNKSMIKPIDESTLKRIRELAEQIHTAHLEGDVEKREALIKAMNALSGMPTI